VDETGVIIVGHTRYKAAVKLGLKEVPVHVAVGLSPAQAKAYQRPTVGERLCFRPRVQPLAA
jgi:ParB-like chromosome segregation protein Spo0J